MGKRQRNLAIVSLFVAVVVVLAIKSIYTEVNISQQKDDVVSIASTVEETSTTKSPWDVETEKKVDQSTQNIKETLGKVEKKEKHNSKDSVQELKMYCVCSADGCHKCVEIEEATKSMYAENENVNIQFTTLNMKDRSNKDFVDQMQIKDESVVLIKGWRKKKVKLSNFKEGEELESEVKKVVDNI
ncbi:hypothetical protein K5X82_11745 [Halosquirtibacter xylanolyticus]|uniref:hypothetical protein n=1 Tax=Halosquirtibacter xylanolyticus TaxID=3374599 RepID=UPI0037498B28|nr:hypothetical protein K5X82_11745 [Prolixibacteraceae bacterium]